MNADIFMSLKSTTFVDLDWEAEKAYRYANEHKTVRMPHLEEAIMHDPGWAMLYANSILGKPWPEAEDIIATSPVAAKDYALFVLKGRFYKAEEGLAKSDMGIRYLKHFPEAWTDWLAMGWITVLHTYE